MTSNKVLLIILFAGLNYITSIAQNNTTSPYSMYGIGNIEYKGDVINMGMGHTGLALPSKGYINTVNPATLSQLDSLSMLFNLQGKFTFSTFSTSSSEQHNFNSNINAISMAFKVNSRWGMALSLAPYSNVGYDIESSKYIIGTTQTYPVNYTGEGGITEISWANGIEVFKHFSVGLKASLLWGSIESIETSEYASLSGTTINNSHLYHVNNFNLEYGFMYTLPIRQNTLSIGGNYVAETNLNTWAEHEIYTDAGSVYYSERENSDNLFLPSTYGIGLAYNIKDKWLLAADYHHGDWANIDLVNTKDDTKDTQHYNAGIEFTPQKNVYKTIFNRMKYRVGAFYSDNYLVINGVNLSEKGLTAGVTIPLKQSSLLNFGYEYKMGGSTKNGLIAENFHSVKLGITFNEPWFKKSLFK